MKTLIFGVVLSLVACGGDLNVGDSGDASTADVVGTGSCKASDCSAYSIQCSSGKPTNLQCGFDTNNQSCTLTGQCTDPTATQTCNFTLPTCSGNGPCSEISGVPEGGAIVLASDPTTSATTLSVDFSSTTTQTIGACTYQSTAGGYSYAENQPIPNEGTVTATTTSFTLADSPACDGTYAPASTSQLVDQGSVVTFSWAGVPNTTSTTLPSIPAPHAITVTGGTLSSSGTTLSRANDATLAWTPVATPLSLEQVEIDLVQGAKKISCRFTSSDQTGVVPADALLELSTGAAQFQMYSVHSAATSDETATTFNVTRQATFADSTSVSGTLTLQ